MASEAPFSLHCIICFDNFDLDNQYPVILPCGHTYVCLQCAKRLEVCMECRSSLYHKVPKAPTMTENPVSTRYGSPGRQRYYQTQTQSRRPPKIEKIPLPLPKNLVLISLIEAARREASANSDSSIGLERTSQEKYDFGNDESNDVAADVVAGIRMMSSPCGVYAVKEKKGLVVFPVCDGEDNDEADADHRQGDIDEDFLRAEEKRDFLDECQTNTEESKVNTNQDCYQHDHCVKSKAPSRSRGIKKWSIFLKHSKRINMKKNVSEDKHPTLYMPNSVCQARIQKNAVQYAPPTAHITAPANQAKKDLTKIRTEPARPFKISYGQRVQVVDFKGGVAKLQRGEGFIVADHSQLVKVGGPQGKACEIEGMLWSIRARKCETENKLVQLERVESQLLKELDKEALLQNQEPTILEALHKGQPDPPQIFQAIDNELKNDTSICGDMEHHQVLSSTVVDTVMPSPSIREVIAEEEEGIASILLECAKMSGHEYLLNGTNYIAYLIGAQNGNNDSGSTKVV